MQANNSSRDLANSPLEAFLRCNSISTLDLTQSQKEMSTIPTSSQTPPAHGTSNRRPRLSPDSSSSRATKSIVDLKHHTLLSLSASTSPTYTHNTRTTLATSFAFKTGIPPASFHPDSQ
ncbi:hypothetical protein BJ508DRAFT_334892 [Ascobolus immersus RN42]|uniref:Uncharacterized protein n=1 Tax=Ascobolus immersus RN42 TaxID=1160509 RepID=A0A3N4HED5_ASCIM|nr:hypothetical protein BJ508DRAFT_334892 [Ascobolus immersus RN42]